MEELLNELKKLQDRYERDHKNAQTQDRYVYTMGQRDAMSQVIKIIDDFIK